MEVGKGNSALYGETTQSKARGSPLYPFRDNCGSAWRSDNRLMVILLYDV